MTSLLRPIRSLLAAAACTGALACGAPASVDGVFSGHDFRLDSDAALFMPTASGRDIVVVLSQIDGETLRTVSVQIPAYGSRPVGEALAVGTGAYGDERPSIDVAVGALLVETRPDGAEIISSTDAAVAATVAGALTLASVSDTQIAGAFRVDLDDGGYLDGSFVASRAR